MEHVALGLFGDWTFVNVVSGLGVMRTCEVVQMMKLPNYFWQKDEKDWEVDTSLSSFMLLLWLN